MLLAVVWVVIDVNFEGFLIIILLLVGAFLVNICIVRDKGVVLNQIITLVSLKLLMLLKCFINFILMELGRVVLLLGDLFQLLQTLSHDVIVAAKVRHVVVDWGMHSAVVHAVLQRHFARCLRTDKPLQNISTREPNIK